MVQKDTQLDKSITIYYSQKHERKPIQPLVRVAKEAGYEVSYTKNSETASEIGIYTQNPDKYDTISATKSILLPHAYDQYLSPHKWGEGNTKRFDFVMLPGEHIAQLWKSQSWWDAAVPKRGVYITGMPKHDLLDTSTFKSTVDEHASTFNVDPDTPAILYAPGGGECDNKLLDVVAAAKDVGASMLLRYGPWVDSESVYDRHGEIIDDNMVSVLPYDDIDIMHCLALSDVVVSEETSVLYESCIFDTVPIVVTDWPLRKKENRFNYSTFSHPDFSMETTRDVLTATLRNVVANHGQYLEQVETARKTHFSHIGTSSAVILEMLDSVVAEEELPLDPVSPTERKLTKYYWLSRRRAINTFPTGFKNRLYRTGLPKIVRKVDSLLTK